MPERAHLTVLKRGVESANLEGADFFRAALEGADLSGANLLGARNLNCLQLAAARNWQSALRDAGLACGAAIPAGHGHD